MTDDELTTKPDDVETPAEPAATTEETPVAEEIAIAAEPPTRRRPNWGRVLAYGVLPALALLLALTAGALKYVDSSVRDGDVARVESEQAAKTGTVAILSYTPDKVEQQLTDARKLLSGDFAQQYLTLINNVVIPGSQQKGISALATVPAVASVSADSHHAVVMVFVNQTVVVGSDAPTNTASSVRVTLDKSGGTWLISAFDPV